MYNPVQNYSIKESEVAKLQKAKNEYLDVLCHWNMKLALLLSGDIEKKRRL